jgi:hypothetical protein
MGLDMVEKASLDVVEKASLDVVRRQRGSVAFLQNTLGGKNFEFSRQKSSETLGLSEAVKSIYCADSTFLGRCHVLVSDSLFRRLLIVDHYERPAVEKSKRFAGIRGTSLRYLPFQACRRFVFSVYPINPVL